MAERAAKKSRTNSSNSVTLWSFLNEEKNAARMMQASDARRPAAESTAEELYRRFEGLVRQERGKQYTGRLIKEVMEANEYQRKELDWKA